jgi:hypothetical protein
MVLSVVLHVDWSRAVLWGGVGAVLGLVVWVMVAWAVGFFDEGDE